MSYEPKQYGDQIEKLLNQSELSDEDRKYLNVDELEQMWAVLAANGAEDLSQFVLGLSQIINEYLHHHVIEAQIPLPSRSDRKAYWQKLENQCLALVRTLVSLQKKQSVTTYDSKKWEVDSALLSELVKEVSASDGSAPSISSISPYPPDHRDFSRFIEDLTRDLAWLSGHAITLRARAEAASADKRGTKKERDIHWLVLELAVLFETLTLKEAKPPVFFDENSRKDKTDFYAFAEPLLDVADSKAQGKKRRRDALAELACRAMKHHTTNPYRGLTGSPLANLSRFIGELDKESP